MTGPIDINRIVPAKYKPFVGFVGAVLAFAVPYVVQVEQYLPSPWPAVIGFVIALLTFLGVYHAPYVPPGAVLAPDTVAVANAAKQAPPAPGEYRNQWRQ